MISKSNTNFLTPLSHKYMIISTHHISATIVQDSINKGKRITTFELDYPRFIHSELMTHRMFSRNAASSRAIPVDKMLEHIIQYPAVPVYWGKNMPGMQSKEELEGTQLAQAKLAWSSAVESAVSHSKEMLAAGLHKQYANRNTEFAQTMKTVVTATEWDNWFELRNHGDAQNDIHELASLMHEALKKSIPMEITDKEWHVPYVTRERSILHGMAYYAGSATRLTDEEARMISASCCAQVSYRRSDDTLEKAKMIYDKLISSRPMHASPVEHQAKPMQVFSIGEERRENLENGVTHVTIDGRLGSGNFYGWIQHRQLI